MKATKGNTHQGYPYYFDRFAGRQCTAIAYVAIVLFLNIHSASWNEHHLDEIVHLGHRLFIDVSIALHQSHCPRNLLHSEVNGRHFCHSYGMINYANLELNQHYGVVGRMSNRDAGSSDLFSALHDSLSLSPGVLLTIGDQTIGLFHTLNDDAEIYLFDSHARSEYGIPDGNGTSVLLEFQNLIECYDYIARVYNGQTFDISTVSMPSVMSQELPSRPTTDFDVDIAHASTHVSAGNDLTMSVDNNFTKTFEITDHRTKADSDGNEFIPSFHVTHDALEQFLKYVNPNGSNEICADHTNITDDKYVNCATGKMFMTGSESTQNFNEKHTNTSYNDTDGRINDTLQFCEDSNNMSMIRNINTDHNYYKKENSKRRDKKKREVKNCPLNFAKKSRNCDNDHTYCVEKSKLQKNRKEMMHTLINDHIEDCVGSCARSLRNDAYQTFIESTPSYFCKCCQRFMYRDQLFLLNKHFPKLMLTPDDLVCFTCKNSIGHNKIPTFSSGGNSLDIGEIPSELQNLNLIEKRLISKVGNFFTLILLPGFPVGQFGEKGYVIHFPVDTNKICEQLQSFCDSNKKMAIVSCSCQGRLSSPKLFSLSKVCKALQWLKDNNPLYHDINVPQFNLQEEPLNENDQNFDPVEVSAVCLNYSNSGNPDIIDLNANYPVELHTLKFSEEKTFPWLFPYGINGYDTDRERKMTLGQYYKFRFCNKDSRWRQNITYLINAVNLYEKQYLSQLISVYTRIRRSEHPNSRPLTANDVVNGTNPDFRENSFMFMKNIRGTVAYWKQVLFNLLAMIKNLGSPTLFMTLSCNDYHWEELAMTLQGKKKCDIDLGSLPKNVQKDPLMTAKHFERRWRGLLKYVINGPNKPLGVIVDYFARVEFQARGSPHMHIFLWVKDVPNLLTARNAENITTYIDSVISTTIPDMNSNPDLSKLVKTLQIHSHRKYCLRRNICRFNFPFPICNQTKIIVPYDSLTSSKRFYETKRSASDTMVNSYNPEILSHWRANMDIQMIGGPNGVAYYVCSYICKAEPDTLKNAISSVLREISNNSDTSTRSKMFKLGMCILKHRTLSAQEAAYRICGLQLIWSTRETITIFAFPPHKQYKKLKSKKEREGLAENSTDIFENGKLDYYYIRPVELTNVSLFRFYQCYKVFKKATMKRGCLSCLNPEFVTKERCHKAVIRPITASKNTPEYYYSLLMLYLPHRHPSDIASPSENITQVFSLKHSMLDKQALSSCNAIPTIEDAIKMLRLSTINFSVPIDDAHDDIEQSYTIDTLQHENQSIEIENIDALNLMSTTGTSCDKNNVVENMIENQEINHAWHNLVVGGCLETIQNRLQYLTQDQRRVMNLVQQSFNEHNTPFRYFITGGAGVGKSFLVECLIDWIRSCTAPFGGVDPILVCAPTGVSAFNINGRTLHSVFHLPVAHSHQQLLFQEIPSKLLPKMKQTFKYIHTVIIDEISMVSDFSLDCIHKRLTVLKENEDLFGGVNMIVVGDFFQLRPVRGRYAFRNEMLWPFFKPQFLTQNVRQLNDLRYAELLNHVRIGFLDYSDIELLQTRIVSSVDRMNRIQHLHIFPTVRLVKEHNEFVQSTLTETCYCIEAVHYFSNNDLHPEESVPQELIPLEDRDAGGLLNKLYISVGTRVMLLRNLETEVGLVNGALGYVSNIQCIQNRYTIFVKFDNVNLPSSLCSSKNQSISIPTYKQEFVSAGRILLRETFPLTPCWASTIHKVQGLSLDEAVVYIGPEIFEKGQAYVALSRVKTLQGLHLLSLCVAKIQADPRVISEYFRLQISEAVYLIYDYMVIFLVLLIAFCL